MPAAIVAGIGAAGSIISGLTGAHAASSAGRTIMSGANQSMGQVADQWQKGQAAVSDATAAAQGGMASAVQAGQGGIASATQAGQGTIASGVEGANTGLDAAWNGEQGNLNPYLNLGAQGADQFSKAMAPGGDLTKQFAFDPTQIANTPEYQFQMAEGTKALQRAQAAKGQSLGGGALKSLAQYGQGLASTSYQQAYNNALTTFQTNRAATLQPLSMMLGYGQNATGMYNQAAQNWSNTRAGVGMQGAGAIANMGMQGAGSIANLGVAGANYIGNTGLQGQEFNAQLGMRGAEDWGNFMMQGAQGKASGIVGAANAWQPVIGNLTNLGQSIASGAFGSGGGGGGGAAPDPGQTYWDTKPYGG